MTIINKILERFKNNYKVQVILKYIRAVALSNIVISCISIIRRTFIINNFINFKAILLMIIMSIGLKKVKISPICGIFLSGILGIIFKISF